MKGTQVPIASLLLLTRPAATEAVAARLDARPEFEFLDRREQTLAFVARAASPAEQDELHRELRAWDGVLDVTLVFQGTDSSP